MWTQALVRFNHRSWSSACLHILKQVFLKTCLMIIGNCNTYVQVKTMFTLWPRRLAGLVVRASDSGARGWGFDPHSGSRTQHDDPSHSGHRVVSLSKTHLPPKSTGNTQEAVAPSQHDWKIVYRDVKNQINQPTVWPNSSWHSHSIWSYQSDQVIMCMYFVPRVIIY